MQVVNFSSQGFFTSSCGANNLVDESNATWCSNDGNLPQSFVVELPNEHMIFRVGFDNSASGDTSENVREVRVFLSNEGEDIGFQEIGTFTLSQSDISQGFAVEPPVRARWIKVDILSNYGSVEQTRLMEFRVIGQKVLPE
jgi:hypothetical protein